MRGVPGRDRHDPPDLFLGLRTVGRSAAIVGSALVALSPFLIFYSTEARAYALVMFLVLASTLALLEAISTNRLGWWAAYAVLGCAAMYSHYTAVFALAAQLLWALVVHPERTRELLGASLAAAIGFAPWLPALIKNTSSPGTQVFDIVDPFGLHAVTHDLSLWAIGHPYIELGSEPGTVAIVLILAGTAGAGAGALGAFQGSRERSIPALRSSSLLLPVLLALAHRSAWRSTAPGNQRLGRAQPDHLVARLRARARSVAGRPPPPVVPPHRRAGDRRLCHRRGQAAVGG